MTEVQAELTGTVWKITVSVGQEVNEGDTVVILESMKMEIPVEANASGKIKELKVTEGQVVEEGEVVAIIE